MTEVTFRRLPGRPADWNERIAGYPAKTLFHETSWLDHVEDIHPSGRHEFFELYSGGEVVGVHCGFRLTKLGLPIHGSPLGGTGTNFQGPLVRDGIDQAEVIRSLLRLSGLRQFLHVELANDRLDPQVMTAAGFTVHSGVTHVIPLEGGEEAVWGRLKSTCRNRVRKAQQNGLITEVASDPAIALEFYDQFVEIYGKQGMVTPFGPERAVSLFRHLQPAGRLLALRVRHGEEVVAAGLFPFDEHAIYFWGAGSWLRHQHLCPNELIQWEVMRQAVALGIPLYNMCGGNSQFKDKFGGADVPYLHYSRSSVAGLGLARRLYRRWHFYRLKAKATSA